jgi:hypothetical protein
MASCRGLCGDRAIHPRRRTISLREKPAGTTESYRKTGCASLPLIDETIQMASHHHIPLFLLDRWASDGRLFSYHWSNDTAEMRENRRTSVQSACQLHDSDSIQRGSVSSGAAWDHDFFTWHVDTPAAAALDTMLRQGVSGLTVDQRSAWARLIVSFWARTPEALRALGAADYRNASQIASARGERSLGTKSWQRSYSNVRGVCPNA